MKIQFEPRDVWIGLYWKVDQMNTIGHWVKFYLCIIPCFPIVWRIWRRN